MHHALVHRLTSPTRQGITLVPMLFNENTHCLSLHVYSCGAVDEVLSEYGNVMRVVEVSTDENPECVAECKVRSVPTLILFDKGKAEVTVVGAIPKNALVHALRKHLKAGV
eukprot:TRINITY_DN1084_c0_g1_i1.p3 TRINITY_DN1084_c0_g1~~TRINITY_DN1084_c0_g1_i1.p3  ORF type:complete len:111 (+),score=15.36 TRINITY_DN1084_c0_g1_i1:3978-4310(+)